MRSAFLLLGLALGCALSQLHSAPQASSMDAREMHLGD